MRLKLYMTREDFQHQVFPLRDKIFRFARRLLEHTEEAEDIVQEVFIRLWKIREKLHEYHSLEALTMVTTKNLCLDRIRARRYPMESLEKNQHYIENLPAETRADHSDLVHSVHQALKKLPEQQKMIVHLRDIEGFSFEAIAEIVEMNENAIRVALSRGRKRIRELITNSKVYEYQRN